MLLRCCGNMFTAPLPRNGLVFLSTTPFFSHDTLLPTGGCSSRVAYRRIAISSPPRGHACDIYDRLREWHLHVVLGPTLCFRSWQRSALIPLGLNLALLFPNCSLLRTDRLERRGHFASEPPSVWFWDQRSPLLQASPLWVGPAF
jgi:hypothetical protein